MKKEIFIKKTDNTFLGVIVSLMLAIMVNLLTSYGVHWSLKLSDLTIFLHAIAILLMLIAIRNKLLFDKECEKARMAPSLGLKEIEKKDVVENVCIKKPGIIWWFNMTLFMSVTIFIFALVMAISNINSIKSDEDMERTKTWQKKEKIINLLNKTDSMLERQNNLFMILKDSLSNKGKRKL